MYSGEYESEEWPAEENVDTGVDTSAEDVDNELKSAAVVSDLARLVLSALNDDANGFIEALSGLCAWCGVENRPADMLDYAKRAQKLSVSIAGGDDVENLRDEIRDLAEAASLVFPVVAPRKVDFLD